MRAILPSPAGQSDVFSGPAGRFQSATSVPFASRAIPCCSFRRLRGVQNVGTKVPPEHRRRHLGTSRSRRAVRLRHIVAGE